MKKSCGNERKSTRTPPPNAHRSVSHIYARQYNRVPFLSAANYSFLTFFHPANLLYNRFSYLYYHFLQIADVQLIWQPFSSLVANNTLVQNGGKLKSVIVSFIIRYGNQSLSDSLEHCNNIHTFRLLFYHRSVPFSITHLFYQTN